MQGLCGTTAFTCGTQPKPFTFRCTECERDFTTKNGLKQHTTLGHERLLKNSAGRPLKTCVSLFRSCELCRENLRGLGQRGSARLSQG